MCVARFSIAIDRPKKKDGEQGADFPRIVCFGKTAELIDRYVKKGQQVAVQGRIQTGSYQDKDGKTVYTTDVVADRVKFLDRGENRPAGRTEPPAGDDDTAMQFEMLGENLPF